MRRSLLLLPVSILIEVSGCGKKAATAQDDLDRKFGEMMKGVTLVGRDIPA
jgi:hypothetical protein